jgi:hypothetical protein
MPAARSYRTLWLIVGLLVLPFVLASALYFGGWRPTPRVAGELLPTHGPLLPEAVLDGHWGLALVSDTHCDAACEQAFDDLRRIHVSLYKHMPAVRRLWLGERDEQAARVEALHARWPDLRLPVVDGELRRALLAGTGAQPASDGAAGGRRDAAVIVFDPAGRAVLRYRLPVDPRAVRGDLKRLLSPLG